MIYVSAQNSQEIAQYLRGEGEVSEAIRAEKVADRLLGRKSKTGIVITAPRQSGKTTEMLRFAEEKYPNGKFAIICLNKYMIDSICHMYRDLKSDPNVMPPLMLLPDNLRLVGNERRPLFCDELSLFSEQMREDILGYHNFEAAVTS